MGRLRVLIAGGGIGGLSAALALAENGCEVGVFEQAPGFTEAGAGIQLSPNATRVLNHFGLDEAIRASAFIPEGTQFRHWRRGHVIAQSHLGAQVLSQYGAPYYHIHRGDLLATLVDAAHVHPNIELYPGVAVTGFDETSGGVWVTASDASHEAHVLVGADGIHSRVHAALWGRQDPQFTGNVAWRTLVPTAQLPADLIRPLSTVWWGPGKHFVHYYVRGGDWVNCVCVVEKSGWQVESWTEQGDFDELRRDFAGWHSDIAQLLEGVDRTQLYKWALFDRSPMQQWGKGRVTLLGDACHPTLPFMAQGAAMAIEDAAVLAGCLHQGDDVVMSLQRYEELRRARTARIQAGSRRNAKVFHLSGIPAWLRNRAAKRAGGRMMDDLYRYDALQVVDQERAN
ncbi:MAG: FAD-dependent monooxygenase [bacterium]